MTPDEKKERVRFLWGKVRTYVKMQRFVANTQKGIEEDYLNEFAQDSDEGKKANSTNHDELEKDQIQVYLFRHDSTGVLVLKTLLGLLLF